MRAYIHVCMLCMYVSMYVCSMYVRKYLHLDDGEISGGILSSFTVPLHSIPPCLLPSTLDQCHCRWWISQVRFMLLSSSRAGMNPPAQHVADSWGSAEFFANKVGSHNLCQGNAKYKVTTR
jgi:hypothetical protein